MSDQGNGLDKEHIPRVTYSAELWKSKTKSLLIVVVAIVTTTYYLVGIFIGSMSNHAHVCRKLFFNMTKPWEAKGYKELCFRAQCLRVTRVLRLFQALVCSGKTVHSSPLEGMLDMYHIYLLHGSTSLEISSKYGRSPKRKVLRPSTLQIVNLC